MVIGGGGREHAIIKALKKNPRVDRLYALPGNGGMREATPIPVNATDLENLVRFAQVEHIDYAVVSPDDPLVLGAVDALEAAGIRCFGPNRAAAQLEGSKSFAKAFMERHHIPTARFAVFEEADSARRYVEDEAEAGRLPIVIKADGLALGKGVLIAETKEEAMQAVHRLMEEAAFGDSGRRVVIEEFLEGPEITLLALTDGETIVPLVSSMDHKRAFDGDQGPNTGGMGVIAPNPFYTEEVAEEAMRTIYRPTIDGMREEGHPFRGCLYFGLMLTKEGPKVIEYNCRFGDPEAQTVLALLESDLLTLFEATTDGTLAQQQVSFRPESACCLVLASEGYPVSYEKHKKLSIPEDLWPNVYIAGAVKERGTLYTNGGRVLGIVETRPTLQEAVDACYADAERITFENKTMRHDIGHLALDILRHAETEADV